ncbi:MAG: NADH-quinone oxidoreductase subunit NuoF [Planctomycetes bacterium]|nr:NADH-quinone oxidoreductase subunit NuoF [Planctomycetota bacterium]MBI3846027.1 NADH-quinone oxidoreductase subunit NuoF [Planctomycetota bacterium]
MGFDRVLTRNVGKPDSRKIDTYLAGGGYSAARKAVTSTPDEVVKIVSDSGLRGRGGAGFPTGKKWSFIPKNDTGQKFLCCNADESEPGTFKDRVLLEHDPHLLIDGMIVSAYAIQATRAFIYIRGEMHAAAKILEGAVAEAYARGFLGKKIFGSAFDLDITVYRGAGAYICGEETGLIESLEGKRGWPRIKPPFPAIKGLFGRPTVVNNVETLCCVPPILERGASWFASIGTPNNTGPKLYCVSGHVNRPGVYELPLGTPMMELLDQYAGGIWKGRTLKAVIPGGSSAAVLTAPECQALPLDFDSCGKAHTMLGSAGVIVMDDHTCMVDAALNVMRFYAHESCGQCTPCREGTTWVAKILNRDVHGQGLETDPDLLLDVCRNIEGRAICPLADGAVAPVASIIRKFRSEFDHHVKHKSCDLGKAAVA